MEGSGGRPFCHWKIRNWDDSSSPRNVNPKSTNAQSTMHEQIVHLTVIHYVAVVPNLFVDILLLDLQYCLCMYTTLLPFWIDFRICGAKTNPEKKQTRRKANTLFFTCTTPRCKKRCLMWFIFLFGTISFPFFLEPAFFLVQLSEKNILGIARQKKIPQGNYKRFGK